MIVDFLSTYFRILHEIHVLVTRLDYIAVRMVALFARQGAVAVVRVYRFTHRSARAIGHFRDFPVRTPFKGFRFGSAHFRDDTVRGIIRKFGFGHYRTGTQVGKRLCCHKVILWQGVGGLVAAAAGGHYACEDYC